MREDSTPRVILSFTGTSRIQINSLDVASRFFFRIYMLRLDFNAYNLKSPRATLGKIRSRILSAIRSRSIPSNVDSSSIRPSVTSRAFPRLPGHFFFFFATHGSSHVTTRPRERPICFHGGGSHMLMLMAFGARDVYCALTS